jgi:putative flippase GtrA
MADDLTPRSGSRMSRRQREDRGFQLVVVGGAAAAITVVTAVLAIAGVLGWGLPFLALIVAVACALLFRRLAGRR